jgi:hypothetical protein
MKRKKALISKIICIFIVFIILIISIFHHAAEASNGDDKRFKPKKEFDITEISIKGDTLSFVSSNDYLWYPFGVFKNIDLFKKVCKKASVEQREYSLRSDTLKYITNRLHEIKIGRSKLILHSEPDNFEGLTIIKGTISDNSIEFKNNIQIGMSKSKFMHNVFDAIPKGQIKHIRVVEMISIVDGMWHYYTFNNGKLIRVDFESHSRIKIK